MLKRQKSEETGANRAGGGSFLDIGIFRQANSAGGGSLASHALNHSSISSTGGGSRRIYNHRLRSCQSPIDRANSGGGCSLDDYSDHYRQQQTYKQFGGDLSSFSRMKAAKATPDTFPNVRPLSPPSLPPEDYSRAREANKALNGGLAAIFMNYLQLQRQIMGINNKVTSLGKAENPPNSPIKENTWSGNDGPLTPHLSTKNQANRGSVMLDSNRVRMIRPYLNYSSIVTHAIEEFYEGRVRGKLDRNYIFFDRVIYYFVVGFALRNLALAFIEDVQWRGWLGETEFERPQRQMMMIYTILSVYIYMIYKTLAKSPKINNLLSWLAPFQVLRGESTSKSFGLDPDMLDRWYAFTLGLWRWYFILSLGCIINVSILYLALIRHRWNTHNAETWFNVMQIFWAIVSILWSYVAFTLMYIHFVYFNSLCFYFRIRFDKVNNDIEVIINQRLKANERVQMLQHILIEHNELCLKVSEYNHFWAKYLMSSYFYLISIICFTAFQAFFTTNYIYIRGAMFLTAGTAAFLITRTSVSASVLSNTAHAPYNRLIRVTFEKYPIELQIQLRMFIQRTSGPTIGFYCLDVFEITYTTYASILAALGQNFLLIVDFVRSYAEVNKEYEEINLSDFGAITNSLFNSTLDVLDEMTGTHISGSIVNNSMIHSIIQQ